MAARLELNRLEQSFPERLLVAAVTGEFPEAPPSCGVSPAAGGELGKPAGLLCGLAEALGPLCEPLQGIGVAGTALEHAEESRAGPGHTALGKLTFREPDEIVSRRGGHGVLVSKAPRQLVALLRLTSLPLSLKPVHASPTIAWEQGKLHITV